jgi:hypothetical protein
MEGNIGVQIVLLCAYAISIILAITFGSRILRKAKEEIDKSSE